MRKLILTLCTAGILTSVIAFADDYESLKKQTNILTEILKTSMEQEITNDDLPAFWFEHSYLDGQGILLLAKSGYLPWQLVEFSAPKPSMPLTTEDEEELSKQNLDVVVDQSLEDTYQVIGQLTGEYPDEWFEITTQLRDIDWNILDKKREIRDLEFELRRADERREKEIEIKKDQIQKELLGLSREQDKLQQRASELKGELEAKRHELEGKQRQMRKASLKRFETKLAKTLCNYGITLKALPDGEKVSVILKGFYPVEKEDSQDKIYIFDKAELVKCVSHSNPDSLLEAAKSYRF